MMRPLKLLTNPASVMRYCRVKCLTGIRVRQLTRKARMG